MKYKFKDILNSYTAEKRRNTSLWAKCFSRPLSFIITYILINLGFSANVVSIISLIEALVACGFVLIGGEYTLIGIILFLLWDVLDCTDGNIARVKKKTSLVGVFFDAISGYTAVAFIYLSVGVAAFRTTSLFFGHEYIFILLGAMASLFDLLARLIYQKFTVTEFSIGSKKEDTFANKINSGFYKFAMLIQKNLTFSSLFMPLMLISYFFNKLDYLIIFYCIYSFCFYLASLIYFIKKVGSLRRSDDV